MKGPRYVESPGQKETAINKMLNLFQYNTGTGSDQIGGSFLTGTRMILHGELFSRMKREVTVVIFENETLQLTVTVMQRK
jgi:hypothetical protein